MTRRAALSILFLLAGACVPGEGPMMTPFQDCLGCHQGGGDAPTWTAAGTWARGAAVTITDSNGKRFTLKGNDAGNFYTAESLAFPITVSVDGKGMPVWDPVNLATVRAKLSYAGCNACHHGRTVTVGEFMAPGTDCLVCHGPGGMAQRKFSAAGTFPPANRQVTVDGHPARTNAVGNFYIDAATSPIDFATRRPASVDANAMPGGAPRGGCNGTGCHNRNGNAGD